MESGALCILGSQTSWPRRKWVILESKASEEVSVNSGVPQGTVLGPLLFLCQINDFLDSVKSTVCLFTDDCLLDLCCKICSFQDHLTLQSWPQTAGRMGQEVGDALQCTKVLHPLNEKQVPLFLQFRWGHLETSSTEVELIPWGSNCCWPQVNSPYLWCLQEGKINLGLSMPQSPGLLEGMLSHSIHCSGAIKTRVWSHDVGPLPEAEHQHTGTHPTPGSLLYHQELWSREHGCTENMLKEPQIPPH